MGRILICKVIICNFLYLLATFSSNSNNFEEGGISYLIDWLIVWCWMPFSNLFQLYRHGQCTYQCLPGIPFTSTLHNNPSKPRSAFQHNHCQKHGHWWERNESCCNDYINPQKEFGLSRGIEPAISCSQVLYATDWAMGLGRKVLENTEVKSKMLISSSVSSFSPKFTPLQRQSSLSYEKALDLGKSTTCHNGKSK